MFNDHALILFACFVGAIVWVLITKIFTYKKLLDEKNIHIIQHYLDGKFLYKNLVNSISMSTASEFCIQLIEDVKEYHNLEDVIVSA